MDILILGLAIEMVLEYFMPFFSISAGPQSLVPKVVSLYAWCVCVHMSVEMVSLGIKWPRFTQIIIIYCIINSFPRILRGKIIIFKPVLLAQRGPG